MTCFNKMLSVVMTVLFTVTCKTPNRSDNAATSGLATTGSQGSASLCVAIRGNGHYIMTHFGALARIYEHYGLVDRTAGGSSASITQFLHESMRLHPLVRHAANDEERALRTALLLKSVMGYLEALKNSEEAISLRLLTDLYHEVQAAGIFALSPVETAEAAARLLAIFKAKKFVALINPNVIAMLENKDQLGYASYNYKVSEVLTVVRSLGKFAAEDQRVFFREGLINFDGLATAIGKLGDFYAGRGEGSSAEMTQFITSCSARTVQGEKPWHDVAEHSTGNTTCGQLFTAAATRFHAIPYTDAERAASRIHDTVGATIPSIVSTAVIEGKESSNAYQEALKRYRQAQTPNYNTSFDSIRFGYWLPSSIAEQTQTQITAQADGKSKKYLELGTRAAWREVIRTSPAEPSLSAGIPLGEQRISVGGWSDLAPVQVLKASGCDKVVYVTRRNPESNFLVSPEPIDRSRRPAHGVAELLNMTEAERLNIYELQNPESGFAKALTSADAVWCTDWNHFSDQQIREMMEESYGPEMVSREPFFIAGERPYKKTANSPIVGCSL